MSLCILGTLGAPTRCLVTEYDGTLLATDAPPHCGPLEEGHAVTKRVYPAFPGRPYMASEL